jgi:hypothetical protein
MTTNSMAGSPSDDEIIRREGHPATAVGRRG